MEELEDPEKFSEEGAKIMTRQEYVSRLHELKDEIIRAWNAGDRVTALKLSIKVITFKFVSLVDFSFLQSSLYAFNYASYSMPIYGQDTSFLTTCDLTYKSLICNT